MFGGLGRVRVRVGVRVRVISFEGLFLGITTPTASLHVNDSRKKIHVLNYNQSEFPLIIISPSNIRCACQISGEKRYVGERFAVQRY